MLSIGLRAVILYLVSVAAMRLMGKRQLGQLQPYELVLALLIADLAASPMENLGTPLMYGIAPILALVAVHGALSLLSGRYIWARRLLCGGPSVLMRGGKVQYQEMKRLNYSLSDLAEAVRGQGYISLAEVDTAILETNGAMNVFPKKEEAPVTAGDLKLNTSRRGLPLTLLMDGRVQPEHLRRCGRDTAWLMDALRADAGVKAPREVLLASLGTDGKMLVQYRAEERAPVTFQAMQEKDVNWQ